MQATTQQKQQFLRLQILQAGYDPQDFIQFMSNHSSICTLISKYRITNNLNSNYAPTTKNSILVQVISRQSKTSIILHVLIPQYRSQTQNKQLTKPNEQPTQKSSKKIFAPERVKLLEEKKCKIQYDKYGLFDYQLKDIVNCIQSQKIVNGKLIEVTVPEIETKDMEGFLFGFGAKTEYYYHIQTNLMKGTVKRLSQDFDWLNSTLLRLYPYLMIPQLEPLRKDIKDPYQRRQKQIEEYLQHLCRKKFLTESNLLLYFLTLSVDKIQKYKKVYDANNFIKGVSKIKNQNGLIQIDLSNRTRQLYNSSKQFSRKTSQLHDSISQAISKMLQSYQLAIMDTTSVINLFAELHDSFNQLGNKFPVVKKEAYNDTLQNLNTLFVGIGNNIKCIKDNLDIYVKDYYKFYNGLDHNLLKLQRYIKDNQSDYLQYKLNLQRKKQRVINNDPSKWDIDIKQLDKKLNKQQLMKLILPKQGLIQNELKLWYAFNLKNYQNQFYCYLKFINTRYRNVFKVFAQELLKHQQEYISAIKKFIN